MLVTSKNKLIAHVAVRKKCEGKCNRILSQNLLKKKKFSPKICKIKYLSMLYIYIYIYITKLVYAWLLILAILFIKLHFTPLIILLILLRVML